MQTMELSKRAFEEIVLKKLQERLSSIVWGENCDTLKDALTFPEDWLFAGISDEAVRKEFEKYLFKEGFTPKSVKYNRVWNPSWCFPPKTKNPKYMAFFAKFTDSLTKTQKVYAERAEKEVLAFGNSNTIYTVLNVTNRIYREFVSSEIAKYNRQLMFLKNSPNSIERREDICYQFSKYGDVIILTKGSTFYYFPQGLEEAHAAGFNAFLHVLYISMNVAVHQRKNDMQEIPRKFKMPIRSHYRDDFKQQLEPLGFLVSFVPKYDETEYYFIEGDENSTIAIYIEVGKLVEQEIEDTFANNQYKQLLKHYN